MSAVSTGTGLPPAVTLEAGWPAVLRPRAQPLRTDPGSVFAWYRESIEALGDLVTRDGAILLRGFAIPGCEAFGRLASLHPEHRFRYVAGASPRGRLGGNVYESTRIDERYKIGLHQEKSYLPEFPRRIAFYCEEPAMYGGETTICDMREVSRRLPAIARDAFAAHGVHFRRNFRDREHRDTVIENSGLRDYHRTWQDAFECTAREPVSAHCRQLGIEYEWLYDGSVTVSNTRPAFIRHPSTDEQIWFNQATTLHANAYSLGATYPAYKAVYSRRAAPPYEVQYGDRRPITAQDLAPLYQVMRESERPVIWERGDYLLLDNILVAHGRNPYRGTRKVRVALFD